jgi:hypothetical protein
LILKASARGTPGPDNGFNRPAALPAVIESWHYAGIMGITLPACGAARGTRHESGSGGPGPGRRRAKAWTLEQKVRPRTKVARGLAGSVFWHMTCSIAVMAKKTSLLKISPQTRASGGAANPQRPSQPAALCLMQLRSHVMRITLSKRRLQIAIEDQTEGELPQPVKINHAD